VSWSEPLHSNRLRASSFGDDAEQYDRVRPPYPPALIDVLLAENPSTVLDVGCGTGIASRLLSARGCEVLGLEPDARMAAVARRHGVAVEAGTFETWEARGRRFDLVVAAQAWHWVDPHVGAVKASEVLRPRGRIGLFWNQAFPHSESRDVMARAYAQHAPALGQNSVLIGQRDEAMYDAIANVARDTGRFEDVVVEKYEHELSYSTEQWLELATTHSDHRTLPEDDLRRLLGALRTEIDAIGALVVVRYQTTLVTGRSRST
jgi:trans-aconitate methyltransferase